jgi:hypothetical protein
VHAQPEEVSVVQSSVNSERKKRYTAVDCGRCASALSRAHAGPARRASRCRPAPRKRDGVARRGRGGTSIHSRRGAMRCRAPRDPICRPKDLIKTNLKHVINGTRVIVSGTCRCTRLSPMSRSFARLRERTRRLTPWLGWNHWQHVPMHKGRVAVPAVHKHSGREIPAHHSRAAGGAQKRRRRSVRASRADGGDAQGPIAPRWSLPSYAPITANHSPMPSYERISLTHGPFIGLYRELWPDRTRR